MHKSHNSHSFHNSHKFHNSHNSRNLIVAVILLLSIILIFGFILKGNFAHKQAHSETIFAMDTSITLTAYGKNAKEAISEAQQEIFRLDNLLSVTSEKSEIRKINNTSRNTSNNTSNTATDSSIGFCTFQVSYDTIQLLHSADQISHSTKGLFDITICPIMELWGFRSHEYKIPTKKQLEVLLKKVDYRNIVLEDNNVTLPADVKIDLGGIAKGYASDNVIDIFKKHGVSSGIITLGGNVQTLGLHPEGRPWNVAIADPLNPDSTFATMELENCAAVTSGGYQRFFVENGIKYHHIIDPRTGFPANSGLISVTIVSPDGTLADGLSTSLFIMGLEEASEYWKANNESFEAVLVTEDGSTYVTEGLADSFILSDGKEPNIIKK